MPSSRRTTTGARTLSRRICRTAGRLACHGAAALCAIAVSGTGSRAGAQPADRQSVSEHQDTLTAPLVLANLSHTPGIVEVRLTAAPARLALEPGKPTDAFAYNGTVPGPTLELHEGDSVIIHFRNELPEPTTVHWHGMHLPARADGSPLSLVPPGSSYDYVFRVGHNTAGTYWYHPHPDRTTTEQVSKGLFGAIIIRADDDPLAGIPEKLLVLSDNRFRPDGSVDLPDPRSLQGTIDAENGREGNVLFVNGQVMPAIPMRSGAVQRWRIVNASAARVYRLAIPGQKLLLVGTDGGLLEAPREVDDVLIANSDRVEVLVRGTGAPDSRAIFQTLPYDRYDPHTRPPDWNQPRDLLTVRYSADQPVTPPQVPATLRVIQPTDTTHVSEHRVLVFSQGLINGRTMDLNRVDITARLGTTEIWRIENVVGMDHPFHLHGFRFQVLDYEGVPASYHSWEDTVNIPKHSVVRIVVHFDDYPGRWMYHCHILDHEDMGMMGILEVR
jgi:FtsP/CotA-like multicopper oxidase with cupredoxin domain